MMTKNTDKKREQMMMFSMDDMVPQNHMLRLIDKAINWNFIYDLVLMDVQMPVMNGYEATKQIRALRDPALAGITILAMTANAFDEDRKKALECGMNGFLSKPIVIEELISTLQNNLTD